GRVGCDVHELGAVAKASEIAWLQKARAGVGRLGPVDAVELRRVANGLVYLQDHLLAVEDDSRHPRRTRVGAEERGGFLAYSRCVAWEVEPFDVLPAGLCAGAAVRARIASDLHLAVADGERVDPASALHELLVDVGTFGGAERPVLPLCPHRRLGDLDVLVPHGALCAQAEVDLLGERDVHRVALGRGAVLAGLRRGGGKLDLTPACAARARAG